MSGWVGEWVGECGRRLRRKSVRIGESGLVGE